MLLFSKQPTYVVVAPSRVHTSISNLHPAQHLALRQHVHSESIYGSFSFYDPKTFFSVQIIYKTPYLCAVMTTR